MKKATTINEFQFEMEVKKNVAFRVVIGVTGLDQLNHLLENIGAFHLLEIDYLGYRNDHDIDDSAKS